MALLLRRKSRYLIAYGSCACMGGIPGLANQFDREEILKFNYEDAPSMANEPKTRPQPTSRRRAAGRTCPSCAGSCGRSTRWSTWTISSRAARRPRSSRRSAFAALLGGALPPKGAVLAPDSALCEECPRKAGKPADVAFGEFKRPHRTLIDPDRCLLAQGVVCMGPATRAGCGAQCLAGNMPCTGCFGPTSRVRDQGAKMISSLCANIEAKEEKDIDRALDGIPDPVGTFYRYGLAKSLLRRRADRDGR